MQYIPLHLQISRLKLRAQRSLSCGGFGEEPVHLSSMSFPNAAQKHTNAMEHFKWPEQMQKQMINALDLDVPRSLQVTPVLSEWGIGQGKYFRVKPESEELTRRRIAMLKEDQKKLKAKKDKEEVDEEFAKNWQEEEDAHHEQMQKTNARFTNRGKLFLRARIQESEQKTEEEAQRAERARTKEIQEAGEKVQIQLVGIEITD